MPKRTRNSEGKGAKRSRKTQDERDLEALVFGADQDSQDTLFDLDNEQVDDSGHASSKQKTALEITEDVDGDALTFSMDFGGDVNKHLDSDADEDAALDDESLFYIDNDATAGEGEDEAEEIMADGLDSDGEQVDLEASVAQLSVGTTAAWEDEDDRSATVSLVDKDRLRKLRVSEQETTVDGDEYQRRLRQRFQSMHAKPSWALTASERADLQKDSPVQEIDDEHDQDVDAEASTLLRNSKSLLSKATRLLSPDHLSIDRVKDANQHARSKSAITALDFHSNGQVMLTGGVDRTLRLFQIDGKNNPMIQAVTFRDMSIGQATFTHSGRYVVVTGQRPYYYIVDVEDGKLSRVPQIRPRLPGSQLHSANAKKMNAVPADRFYISSDDRWIAFNTRNGIVELVALNTRLWAGELCIGGAVVDIAWSNDSRHLYVLSADSVVYRWNVNTRRCVQRFNDHGGFGPTCLAVAPGDRYIAIGSKSGMVNVYDNSFLTTDRPMPLKTLGNLTTSILGLQFSSDAQMLCMYSRSKRDQLRIVHLPSLTVYNNWPTAKTPLQFVRNACFSPNNGYIAIGNDRGSALLYRILQYDRA